MYIKGGLARHVNGSATSSLLMWPIPGGVANFIRFENTGSNPIVLSLNKDDAEAATQQGVTVAASEVLELPAETKNFWTKSAAGSTFEAIAFVRRG